MMRVLASALVFLVSVGFGRTARAEDWDKVRRVENDASFRHLAITANPMSLVIEKIGLNLEYLPVARHALVINPYFQPLSTSITVGNKPIDTRYSGVGAELGYRWYSGDRGANGFFVGPSFVYHTTSIHSEGGGIGVQNGHATSYGMAVDFGGQHVFDNGVTIGAGAGLMYTKRTLRGDPALETTTLGAPNGVMPRLLLTAGYSF